MLGLTACAMTMSAEMPVEYEDWPLPPGTAAVSDWQSPCACPQLVGPPSGKLTFLMNIKLSACAAKTFTALVVAAASDACVSGPTAAGKNRSPFTPHAA